MGQASTFGSIERSAGNVMIERIGFVFGLLDTELAKLALFAGEDGKVSDAIVHELVGGWRTKTVWEVADQIADGKVASAMEQLDRLFASGQNAIGIFAQLSWYFRRYGMAAHCIEQAERFGKSQSSETLWNKRVFIATPP